MNPTEKVIHFLIPNISAIGLSGGKPRLLITLAEDHPIEAQDPFPANLVGDPYNPLPGADPIRIMLWNHPASLPANLKPGKPKDAMKDTLRPYTRPELEQLLREGKVSAEFRGMIQSALADGSPDAIRALGPAGSNAMINDWRPWESSDAPNTPAENAAKYLDLSLMFISKATSLQPGLPDYCFERLLKAVRLIGEAKGYLLPDRPAQAQEGAVGLSELQKCIIELFPIPGEIMAPEAPGSSKRIRLYDANNPQGESLLSFLPNDLQFARHVLRASRRIDALRKSGPKGKRLSLDQFLASHGLQSSRGTPGQLLLALSARARLVVKGAASQFPEIVLADLLLFSSLERIVRQASPRPRARVSSSRQPATADKTRKA